MALKVIILLLFTLFLTASANPISQFPSEGDKTSGENEQNANGGITAPISSWEFPAAKELGNKSSNSAETKKRLFQGMLPFVPQVNPFGNPMMTNPALMNPMHNPGMNPMLNPGMNPMMTNPALMNPMLNPGMNPMLNPGMNPK
uniref:DUF148 domain-containing protein n=1 Tax=Globodera pallida TaxID=36090 RepID=A0A183CCN0_GLOPA